jgi:1-deoxy-D-xylulose 5-phosphate reductoisomerase
MPDMRLPIQIALFTPTRWTRICRACAPRDRRLTFEAPDEARFPPCLARRAAIGRHALRPCLNAAKRSAVAAFLAGPIGFTTSPRW